MRIFFIFIMFVASCTFGMEKNKNYISELDAHLRKNRQRVTEGHVYSRNTNQPHFFKKLLSENPSINTICEIGFNAGHSSVLFLAEKPDISVYSFDIARHDYVDAAKQFIDENFPNRHFLIKGDSNETVPNFYQLHPFLKFDLIFIDGGHIFNIVLNDIKNMQFFANPQTTVVIDDAHKSSGVMLAIEEAVRLNLIRDVKIEISNDKTKDWAICRY